MIREVIAIDWFANVGSKIPESLGQFSTVQSWTDACRQCGSEWEVVVSGARNDLTMHLNRHCKAEYQKWNQVIAAIKQELTEPWQRMREKVSKLKLPSVVADCVEWDTMHAIAEERYREWNPPVFFGRLFKIYESGHFPCGWDGEWPSGQLFVY